MAIGAPDTTGTSLVLDIKTDSGDPAGANGAMYYNSNVNKFRCYENSSWKDCDTAGAGSLQTAYDGGAVITTSGGTPITFTTPDGSNNAGLVINQNNTTDNPVALQITNAGTGNDITATNWSITKAGNLTTGGNVTTTGSGLVTSAGTLTAANGLTMITGALSMTGTSGSINLSGLTYTSIVNTGAMTLTAGAASTWSTSSGALALDSAAALNLGITNATAVSIGRADVNTTVNGPLIRGSIETGLTAQADKTQANATQITKDIAEFSTVVADNDSAKLPAAIPGRQIIIINSGVKRINLFPPVGGYLNGVLNGSMLIMGVNGETGLCVAYKTNYWNCSALLD